MKPPFAYFGGKSGMGPWIADLLPTHEIYVEPFAGSLAVLFAKPPSRHEFVNDLDQALVTFFRVLRDRPEELARAARLTPYSRVEFEEAILDEPGLDDLELYRDWWTIDRGVVAYSSNARRSTRTGRIERIYSNRDLGGRLSLEYAPDQAPLDNGPYVGLEDP